jgi:hypothetical protein
VRKITIFSLFAAIFIFTAAGCATMQTTGHKYFMKGQILDVSDGEVYLCIGSAEGAKADQEFLVYRHLKLPYDGPKQAAPRFKREMIGSVKITQIVDEHFAKANILRGNIMVNDVAELTP